MVLAIAASVFAQEKPPAAPAGTNAVDKAAAAAVAPEPNPVDKFFNGKIPDALAKGKFNLNVRLRYEYVDQDGVASITKPAEALTVRTRFGFTSAPLYGFQAMIEGENISVIGGDTYNAYGSNGKPYRPVVADADTTEINQVWVSYSYTNLVNIKVGRQQINLDNTRFVGDVGWRQNMQTFDAVGLRVNPIKELSLYYAYIWDVHRIFGDVSGLPATSAFHDFDSSSHIFNIAYTPCKYVKAVGYAYLLDLDLNNGTASAEANSTATYGGYVTGNIPAGKKVSIGYRGEYAHQTDYAGSLLHYSADYYNVELSANIKPVVFGAGYEVLGSDNNVGFKTPLATLHAFNGWADAFLNTPNAGLRDAYAFAQVTIPKADVPIRAVYHKFDSDKGGADFGDEIDVVASKKFRKNWTVLAKYSYYSGKDAAVPALTVANVDIQKFWGQIEFNF